MLNFEKPKGVSYTQMCIFFDEHIYDENKTEALEEKLYLYLYHLFYMFSCKKHFYKLAEDHHNFSTTSATDVYIRYMNPNLKKIKSILNYIKATVYGFKVKYDTENFVQIINPEHDKKFDPLKYETNLIQSIQSDYNYMLQASIESDIESIPTVIRKLVEQTPYSSDKPLSNKIYLSLVLTLLNTITLSSADYDILSNKIPSFDDNSKINFLKKLRLKSEHIILWHLDECFHDYIFVLYNKMKFKILQIFYNTREHYTLDNDTISNIISSAYDVKTNQGDELIE